MVDTPSVGIAVEANPGHQESAVAWAAIIAGALAAIAITLVMMIVGSGLGFSLISPWASENPDASTLAVSTLIWFAVTQWFAAGFGGFLAGRLRTQWTDVARDEVFFRDTAHGFLAWALGTVLVAAFLTTAMTTLVGGTVAVATSITSGAVQGASQGLTQSQSNLTDPTGYYVDLLFRSAPSLAPGPQAATPTAPTAPGATPTPRAANTAPSGTTTTPAPGASADRRAVATRILLNGAAAGEIPEADREYLAQTVASETGVSQEEASARVNDVLTQAEQAKAEVQQTAEQAREGAVLLSISMAVALLVGAFIASVTAVLGGRMRDDGWARD